MGARTSTNYLHTNSVRHESGDNNTVSDLYLACRDGAYELALGLLASSSFETINRREPNGSTALHAAVEFGHADIVSLLLDVYGVIRHLSNHDGYTAFELARTDAMRKLFQRPIRDGNRFYGSGNVAQMFSIVRKFKKKNGDTEFITERVQGYNSIQAVRGEKFREVQEQYFGHVSDGFKFLMFQNPEELSKKKQANVLQSLIDKWITSSNSQYAKANELVNCFRKNGEVELLIRLYTLETPFYRHINEGKESSAALASPIIRSKERFRNRAFEGVCFRGLSMTKKDLQAYQWAMQQNDRYLELNIFSSTTQNIDLAKMYAEANENNQRQQVLMVFEFPTACKMAIQLDKLSDTLSALTEFESEQEVLVLPGTLFSIRKIECTESLITIYLIHMDMEEAVDEYFEVFAEHMLMLDM